MIRRADGSPVAFVAALRSELRCLTRRHPDAEGRVPLAGGAVAVLSGTGRARARAAGERLLARGARALVSWGTAAGLDPAMPAGTLLLPERVIGERGHDYPVHAAWHSRVQERLRGERVVSTGPVVSSPTILIGPGEKWAVRIRTGAVGVDMESAALARLAAEAGVPFLVLRAVADTARTRLPRRIASAVDPFGRPRASVIGIGARDWGCLVRLAFGFRAARTSLAAVAEILPEFLLPESGSAAGRQTP